MADLNDSNYYDCVNNDPTERIKAQIKRWTATWKEKGVIDDDQAASISNISETEPGKIKPLIKTPKPQPWLIRVLLSESNTPMQPLSKFFSIQYSTPSLPSPTPDPRHKSVSAENFKNKPTPFFPTPEHCDHNMRRAQTLPIS